jgi:hypothetical protein
MLLLHLMPVQLRCNTSQKSSMLMPATAAVADAEVLQLPYYSFACCFAAMQRVLVR